MLKITEMPNILNSNTAVTKYQFIELKPSDVSHALNKNFWTLLLRSLLWRNTSRKVKDKTHKIKKS